MSGQLIAWWLMALGAVGCACKMVLSKNPVHSALWLVGNFVCLAVIYLLLSAPMLFAVQLIVYAGAIMVLFLFVIMFFMSPKARLYLRPPLRMQTAGGVLLALVFLGLVTALLVRSGAAPVIFPAPASPDDAFVAADLEDARQMGHPRDLGILLFQGHVLPFELTSILLLAALLGAMMVARDELGEGRGRLQHFAPVTHPEDGAPAEPEAAAGTEASA